MKKIIVFAVFGLTISATAFAQGTPKVGWIESSELLSSMPERVKADSDINKYGKAFQEQIDAMIKEYQSKAEYYQSHAKDNSMSDAVREVKMKEIQDLQSRIEGLQQSAQEKMQQKKQELYQPLFDKVNKAIQAVAKEKGYDYIFDKSGGSLLAGKDGDNVLPLVKAQLGIK